MLTGGRRKLLEGELKDGYYLEPTILFGQNNMRVFQEEIFGPVLAVTTFKTMDEALELAKTYLGGTLDVPTAILEHGAQTLPILEQ